MDTKPTTPPQLPCAYCAHGEHPRGERCLAILPDGKRCKCKAGARWWDGFGNAIGETLFGGNR